MATAFLNRNVLRKNVMITAERVNLVYITLIDGDIEENKEYLIKCICGRLFNITLHVGKQEYLKERNNMCKFVTKQKMVVIICHRGQYIKMWGYVLIRMYHMLMCHGIVFGVKTKLPYLLQDFLKRRDGLVSIVIWVFIQRRVFI
jgi:hypothetical protein